VFERAETWEGERRLRLQDITSLLSNLLPWQPKPSFIVLIHSFYILIFSNILYIVIFYFRNPKKKTRIEALIASQKEAMNKFIKIDFTGWYKNKEEIGIL